MANTGLRITIPVIFSNPNLPVLRPDPILPSSGALVLLEPGHPASGDFELVNTGKLPNVASEQAAAMLGVAESAVESELVLNNITAAGTAKGKVERSGKGGIHTIMATSGVSTSDGLTIRPDQAIADHIVANPNHDYYVSLWFRVTRQTDAGQGLSSISLSTTPSSSQLLYSLAYSGSIFPASGNPNRLGGTVDPSPPNDETFMNIGVAAYTGTPTLTGTSARNMMKLWGVGGGLPFNVMNTAYPSVILYRMYIEDLTVSGRTYAEVTTLDLSLYTEHVLTEGGRYYGDTFTDPATVT